MSTPRPPATDQASHSSSSSPTSPDVTALAKGFKKMLVSPSPSLSLAQPRLGSQPNKPQPRAATTTAGASPTSADFDVGLIRAADLAFPSRNDHPDRFPSIPFILDKNELAKVTASKGHYEDFSKAEIDSWWKRSNMEVLSRRDPGDETSACMITFGHGDGSRAIVVCTPATRQILRAHPLFEKTLFVEPLASTMPFYIADVPGRGKGLFAARRLAKGECLLREPPMLVLGLPGREALMRLDEFIDEYMPERAKAAFDALYCCWPSADFSRRIGVMRTNAIAINLPPTSAAIGGVFQLTSRLNHSCAPSTALTWDYKTFQGSLYADREIAGGEELTFSYLSDPLASKAARRAELQKKYKFVCTCTRCGPD